MVRGVGAAGNQSIVLINNQFLFLTSDGDVAVYDGGITVKIISSKIEGTLNALHPGRFEQAVGLAFADGSGDEDYYLCVSTEASGTHDLLLVYDTLFRAWTKFNNMPCNALASYEIGTAQRAMAFVNYTGYTMRYPNTDADDGGAFTAFYQSGHLQAGVPQQKIFHRFQVLLRQQSSTATLAFEYRIDFAAAGTTTNLSLAGTGAIWDVAVWDTDIYADIASALRPVFMDLQGDFILWRVSDTSTNPAFLLRGVRLWIEPTGTIGGSET